MHGFCRLGLKKAPHPLGCSAALENYLGWAGGGLHQHLASVGWSFLETHPSGGQGGQFSNFLIYYCEHSSFFIFFFFFYVFFALPPHPFAHEQNGSPITGLPGDGKELEPLRTDRRHLAGH